MLGGWAGKSFKNAFLCFWLWGRRFGVLATFSPKKWRVEGGIWLGGCSRDREGPGFATLPEELAGDIICISISIYIYMYA